MNINQGVVDGIRRIGGRFRHVIVDGQLPGAPLGLRLMGAATFGPPTVGTWKAGDHTEDRAGNVWVCIAAGNPGTWVHVGSTGTFGDTSDGIVALNGTNTYSFVSTTGSAPNLSYTLLRNVYATSFILSSGITMAPAGYNVFCQGSPLLAGTVSFPGGNGFAAGGAGGAGGGTGMIGSGRAGGAGQTTAGTAGTSTNCTGGGAGVAGGTAGANAGGTGGTVAAVNSGTSASWFRTPVPALTGVLAVVGTTTLLQGGAGGGGGGGDGTNKGGGGGGGGGAFCIFCWSLTITGTINGVGGNGATPATGNGGGGGGGGGGLFLAYTLIPWTQNGTISLGAGTGAAGLGTGGAGTNGSAGMSLNQVLS